MPASALTLNTFIGEAPLSTTPQTTVSRLGASLTFASAVPAGTTVSGDYVIDTSQGAISVTDNTPAATLGDGVDINGLCKNAWFTGAQGFDGRMTTRGNSYNSAFNIAPSKSGNPAITIAQGERCVLTQCIPRAGKTVGDDKVAETYVNFYFMPINETKEGMFSPSPQVFAADASVAPRVWTETDINYSALRSLTPPSGAPTLATTLAPLPTTLGFFGRTDDAFRNFSADTWTSSGYLGDVATVNSAMLMALHYSNTDAAKRDAVIQAVQMGLEAYGMYLNGQLGSTGAGQWHGYHNSLFFAAFLLNDSDLLTAAQTMRSNMRDHPAFPPAWIEGNRVLHPAGSGQVSLFRQTFEAEDIGKPFWWEAFNSEDFAEDNHRGASVVARYATLSLPIGVQEAFPVLLLQNGPGGVSGLDAYLDGPADSTNDRFATLKLYDRMDTWKFRERGYEFFSPYGFNFEDHFTDFGSLITGWGGYADTPDAIEVNTPLADQNFVSAAAGGFSWDLTGYDFGGKQTITDRHVRWSVDERTWIESSGHSDTGSITGLPRGVDVYVQIAKENASGRGRWSPNYPYSDTGGLFANGPRNVVQPTGTEANAAPVNVVAPKIVYKKYPDWDGPSWTDAPTTLTLASMYELSVGVGHWSGFPAPTFSYNWRRNGVSTGVTTQDYTLSAADLGATLDCIVTATNSSGTPTATTVSVSVPSLSSLPAGTIIDTEFDAEFLLRYETEYAAATFTSGATAELRYGFRQAEEAARGTLDITGKAMEMDIPVTLQGGTTYRIEAQLKNRANQGDPTGISFQLRRQSDGTQLFADNNAVDQVLWTIDDTYTPVSNEDVTMYVVQASGNGSASGGRLTRLKISEV